MSKVIDLGGGYIGRLIESDRHPSGYGCVVVRHPKKDGSPGTCGHIASWDGHMPPSHTWTLVSLEPLHIEPSLLCGVCGDHGFIRNGKWVPA